MARETNEFLGYPFDGELFMQMWEEQPDPVNTAMLDSGALVNDGMIAARTANEGSIYTIPFYNILDGAPVNYDGKTDIPVEETTAASQTGVVYGRAKDFSARDFAADLTGADPLGQIAKAVGGYWQKQRQRIVLGILNGVFTTNDASANATKFKASHIADTGVGVNVTDANTLMTAALGENKQAFSLAVMHSTVARNLENQQVLEFWKQTDANGIQRPTSLASWNGLTVVVSDGVPVSGKKYTTYLLGEGVLRRADAALAKPLGISRDEHKNGGVESLVTRVRETVHPNGFSFVVPATGFTESPTDAQLFDGKNWRVVFDPKAIAMAKLVTTES